jgi:hypothetical protein
VRPATLGQAARVPGVTPAAVSILLVHLRRHRERGPDAATAGPVGTRGAGDPARNAR